MLGGWWAHTGQQDHQGGVRDVSGQVGEQAQEVCGCSCKKVRSKIKGHENENKWENFKGVYQDKSVVIFNCQQMLQFLQGDVARFGLSNIDIIRLFGQQYIIRQNSDSKDLKWNKSKTKIMGKTIV